jgi:hypothetical protein
VNRAQWMYRRLLVTALAVASVGGGAWGMRSVRPSWVGAVRWYQQVGTKYVFVWESAPCWTKKVGERDDGGGVENTTDLGCYSGKAPRVRFRKANSLCCKDNHWDGEQRTVSPSR